LPGVERRQGREEIEFPACLRMPVFDVVPGMFVGVDEQPHQVPRAQRARRSADERGNPGEYAGPKCRIQRGIVDGADNISQLIVFGHVTC
jgi:hypothetical protein